MRINFFFCKKWEIYRGGTFSCLRTSSLKKSDYCQECLLSLAHPENPSMTAVLSPAAVAAKRKWSARKPTCAAIPVCSIFDFEPGAVW